MVKFCLPQQSSSFEEVILSTGHLLTLRVTMIETIFGWSMTSEMDFGLIFMMAIAQVFGITHTIM